MACFFFPRIDIEEPRQKGVDGSDLPNVRLLSRSLFSPANNAKAGPESKKLSQWLMQWGQLLNSDLSLTPAGSGKSFSCCPLMFFFL